MDVQVHQRVDAALRTLVQYRVELIHHLAGAGGEGGMENQDTWFNVMVERCGGGGGGGLGWKEVLKWIRTGGSGVNGMQVLSIMEHNWIHYLCKHILILVMVEVDIKSAAETRWFWWIW